MSVVCLVFFIRLPPPAIAWLDFKNWNGLSFCACRSLAKKMPWKLADANSKRKASLVHHLSARTWPSRPNLELKDHQLANVNLTMGSGKTRSRCGIILQPRRFVNLAIERALSFSSRGSPMPHVLGATHMPNTLRSNFDHQQATKPVLHLAA